MRKINKYFLTVIFVAAVITAASERTSATPILDQSQELSNGGSGFYRFVCLAQTFTPAVSGQLDHVDLLIEGFGGGNPDYAATVSVVETVGVVPNGTELGLKQV